MYACVKPVLCLRTQVFQFAKILNRSVLSSCLYLCAGWRFSITCLSPSFPIPHNCYYSKWSWFGRAVYGGENRNSLSDTQDVVLRLEVVKGQPIN